MKNFRRFASLAILLLGLSAASIASAVTTDTFYHWDGLGSPVAATDSQGQLLWREDYKPYGEKIRNQPAAQTNSRWYTGHPHDNATGLTYMGARWYDPAVGRFMGVDPKSFSEGNPQSFNSYNYANNNPYKYLDPDGQCPGLAGAGSVEDAHAIMAQCAAGERIGPDLLDWTLEGFPVGPNVPLKLGGGVLRGVADSARPKVGSIVIGHFPDYVDQAGKLGAKRFNIPEHVWKQMSDAERWTANQKFLDRAISRGDEIILATPIDKVKPGSFFQRELDYLRGKGYTPSVDGTRLLPPSSH